MRDDGAGPTSLGDGIDLGEGTARSCSECSDLADYSAWECECNPVISGAIDRQENKCSHLQDDGNSNFAGYTLLTRLARLNR